ncbi:MAG: hypothetical protein VX589_08770 [Myxococcota bacterium]|nr:hypothetical protein [Myxococcota bacterium]
MTFSFVIRWGLAIASVCSLAACGARNDGAIKAGPAIPNLKLSGKWYSDEFGDMTVVHSGNTVSGTYEDRRGPDHNGRFRGQIKGDILRLNWIKPGNMDAAIMPRRGKAWLRIGRQGRNMIGRWGFDESDTDGGAWTAEKSAYD